MVGTFLVEKYALAAIMTMTVKKLFGKKHTGNLWICVFTAGLSIIAMNLGAGMLYPYTKEQYVAGIAEGVFAGSLLALLGLTGRRLLRRKKKVHRYLKVEKDSPGQERIAHYTKAFSELSKAFLSVPAKSAVAFAGADEYSRVHAVWNCRMEEQRVAVAHQLTEISDIMADAVRRAYETKEDQWLQEELRRHLRKRGVLLRSVFVYTNDAGRQEVYLTVKSGKRKCIPMKEVAEILSGVTGIPMMPSRESRAFVGNEYLSTCFVEQTKFEILYGVERAIGDHQQISGDSFSFFFREEGEFLASLSDGMGSGLTAYQESEKVVDLLEQFLEAGFTKETAVKMINSALVLRSKEQTFSTMDIASIDLYSGVCEFLKVGASTSFIRRDSWVETITSTSLPAGIFHQTDLEKSSRKLYDGDMIIMMTDGVLDALPVEFQEKMMKEIIMEHPTNNPKELADYILSRVRQYQENGFCDDMTVLVAGIWKR
ncbi:MAG: SpoIIE family protein phosphatase [Lachnospiraceae bacterium]